MPKGQRKSPSQIRLEAEKKIEHQMLTENFRAFRDEPSRANLEAFQESLDVYANRFNALVESPLANAVNDAVEQAS